MLESGSLGLVKGFCFCFCLHFSFKAVVHSRKLLAGTLYVVLWGTERGYHLLEGSLASSVALLGACSEN